MDRKLTMNSAPLYDLSEKERCQVCGRERLKFFSKDHCQHTPEEWARADVSDIFRTWPAGRVALGGENHGS